MDDPDGDSEDSEADDERSQADMNQAGENRVTAVPDTSESINRARHRSLFDDSDDSESDTDSRDQQSEEDVSADDSTTHISDTGYPSDDSRHDFPIPDIRLAQRRRGRGRRIDYSDMFLSLCDEIGNPIAWAFLTEQMNVKKIWKSGSGCSGG